MGAVKRIKNVEWEKNRREKLNLTFFELSRLLPDHDPTLTLTKLEILNKSIIYIKELQERNTNLLGTNHSEVLETEMSSLREQVTELQRRNQQLAELLQTAKISLPPRPIPHSEPFTCPRKWAGKLSLDTVAGFKNVSEKKKGESKENPANTVPQPKLSTKKKSVKTKKNLKKKQLKHSKAEASKSERLLVLNSSINPLRELNNASCVQSVAVASKNDTLPVNNSCTPLRELNSSLSVQSVSQTNLKRTLVSHSIVKGVTASTACINSENSSVVSVPVGNQKVQNTLVLSRTVTLPCTTISLVLSNSKTSIVTVAKSNVLPAPIMATGIQPVLQCNPSLSSLGPGTLIMPGGRIVPVPPPPTVLAPALILLPPTTTTAAVTTSPLLTTRPTLKPTSSLRPIVPKPRQRDITKTTFSNKVPIPAITTHRQGLYSSSNPSVIIPHDTKKNLKKKSCLSKQSVKDKCSTELTIVKPFSDTSSRKVDDNNSNKDSVIDTGQSRSCSNNSGHLSALKKPPQSGQSSSKRKCDITNENIKGSKKAKVVENIVPCADSRKSDQECNSLSDLSSHKKCSTDTSVNQLNDDKEPEKVSNRNEKCDNINEIIGNPSETDNIPSLEGALSNVATAVGNKNLVEKENSNNKVSGDVIPDTESTTCNNSVLCSSEKNLQNSFGLQNTKKADEHNLSTSIPKENSQVLNSKEIDNNKVNSTEPVIIPSLCLIAQSTLPKEVLNISEVNQSSSQALADIHGVNCEKHDDLTKTAETEVNKNKKEGDFVNNRDLNTNDEMVLSKNNQQATQPSSKDCSNEKSENMKVNGTSSRDNILQAENSSLCKSNSASKVSDNSTQINLNFTANSNQISDVFCQNSHSSNLNFNNGDPLLCKTSVNFSVNSSQENPTEVLNVNANNNNNEGINQIPVSSCYSRNYPNSHTYFSNVQQKINVDNSNKGNKILNHLEDSNLGVKVNVSQSNQKETKSRNDQVLAVSGLSNDSGNVLNINCRVIEGCQKITTANNNSRDPSNLRNNSFNTQPTLQRLDSVPSVNNPNPFIEKFNFIERVQQNGSSKSGSIPPNKTNISLSFQNNNLNNNMQVVPDSNVQRNSSGNFYTVGNYQKTSNEHINAIGNKLQNIAPVSGNANFTKTHPCSDTNTKTIPNTSTNQAHFICAQNQNPVPNNSLTSNSVAQNVSDTSYVINNQSKHFTKTVNFNSIDQGPNSRTIHSSNEQHVNISLNVTKINNCQNQQQVLKNGEHSNKFQPEAKKTPVSQSCKSTQVSSLQLSFPDNEKLNVGGKQQAKPNSVNSGLKKPVDELKPVCDSKSLIQDDSQELSSLFPTEKLQSCSESLFRETCADFRDRNLFMPLNHSYMEEMRLNLPHSDFSNDLLSSLQVPSTGQHPESISPTAAFLLAFPLVSTSKTSELIAENDGGESQHATPTTILQIGNIEPSSSELFHQTALMMENNPTLIKQNKHIDISKDNSSKQLKDIESFNKFQQMEINELMRNENFSRNNCKDKKHFGAIAEQDMFYPCTKKKSVSKANNYPLPATIVPHMHDKTFEFSESSIRSNTEQGRQINHNEKKNQTQTDNNTSTQNIYNSASQPYTYSSFPNGNEFMLSNSNYLSSNNHPVSESSKSISLASSNFNVISWTTASITSNTSQVDYTTPYCSYPQKPYNNTNQTKIQKNLQTNFEEHKNKEKSISNMNPLPKFANFQFNNSHSNQDVHSYPQPNQADNANYKPESKSKKLKTGTQRAPVNWMTAPDVRPLVPDSGVAPVHPDVMFQHQKELDFPPSAPNNMMMLNSSSNITSFNISTSTSNNSQTFYSNSHFSGVDLQLDFAPFPDITTSKPLRNSTNVPNSQPNPHPYSWSPSKSSIQLMPHIDSHMIPSTLPTLVGDLALGTTTPSGPVDTFRNLSMPTTPFNIEMPVKKYEKKHEPQKSVSKINDKDCFPNSDRRNRTVPEYCQKTHSHQSTNTSSSFLSVSQLVDPVKTEQSSSSRRTAKPSGAKANNGTQKRNTSNQQSDKSKVSSIINNHSNYHNSNAGMMGQRKFDPHSGGYQDVHNTGVGFPGSFSNQQGPVSWQNEKPPRPTTHYKGSYSAESLIADQSTSAQGHVSDLPQFPNQYNHPPVVSSASYPAADFSHQNVQPLEFHQTHQNCFNFPSNSHYSSAPFNPESDYHLGLDPLFNFNPTTNKHSSACQTTAKDNRNSSKRGQNKQRREEFTPQWTPQVYPPSIRPKSSLPPHCPPSTSSPSHQGTTTLTNFNLSTIFPEINDKVGMAGPQSSSNFPSAPNFRPH